VDVGGNVSNEGVDSKTIVILRTLTMRELQVILSPTMMNLVRVMENEQPDNKLV
jgi:hypothetical protein